MLGQRARYVKNYTHKAIEKFPNSLSFCSTFKFLKFLKIIAELYPNFESFQMY